MDSKGWDYDPLNGLTVLKGDMDKWYDADPIIQEHQAKMEYQKELCDTLKEIIFKDCFPTNLSSLEFSTQQTEIEYLQADVTLKYTTFEIK